MKKRTVCLMALGFLFAGSGLGGDISYFETRGEWTQEDGYVEGGGVGAFLYLSQEFGEGDVDIRIRLALSGLSVRGTAASVQFAGDNHFGLDGAGEQLFVHGPAFNRERAQMIRSRQGLFAEGEVFDLRIVRENGQLSFFINEEEIYQGAFSGDMGRVAIRPHRARVRVYGLDGEVQPSAQKLALAEFEERLHTLEGQIEAFLGKPALEIQPLFNEPRFPNVAVALDGTVVATWGRGVVRSRRSPDGGVTWEDEVEIGPGRHGGGLTVDEVSGDLLAWVDETIHTTHLYRSRDQGRSWTREEETVIYPLHRKATGFVPTMHMNERGITLRHGPHKGRLLRATGNYMGGNISGGPADAFCNAIYSDDGGKTWDTSAPFPAFGTNEAAVEELSDGRIIFIARRHRATDGLDTFKKHIAWSYDGGETWRNLRVSPVLPDGNTNRPYGLMHGLARLPVKGHDILVFSNIVSDTTRENGTIWVSFDGGETWPVRRLIDPGTFAYSSLVAGRPGTPSEGWIYLLYEGGGGRGQIARFNLAWVLDDGEQTGDGVIPGWVLQRRL